MAIPLTAKQRAELREQLDAADEAQRGQRGPYTLNVTLQTLRALLDALDAREGQTCGTCKVSERVNGMLVICNLGVRRDFPLVAHSREFGCNQWTPKEPQP